MKIKKVAALGAALGIALAGLTVSAPANAEPVVPNDPTGTFGPFAIVGSDTLESVLNSLTNGLNGVTVTSAGAQIGNYNAFGSTNITTKAGQATFPRPSGSGAGIAALRASILNTAVTQDGVTYPAGLTGDIDIARSSSGPGTNANESGDLVYIPFAQDGLGYAYKGTDLTADQIAIVSSLTKTQLAAIFTTGKTPTGTPASATPTIITVNGVSVTIKPRLPQSLSGTRKDFIAKVGATVATGDYTWEGSGNAGTQENNADVLVASGTPGVAEIIPFSVSNWIAQANGKTSDNTTDAGQVALGSVTATVSGTTTTNAPTTGTAPSVTANAAYYATAFMGRTTYLVVEYQRIQQFLPDGTTSNPKYSARLAALVLTGASAGNGSLASFVTTGVANTVGKVKASFGFLAPADTQQYRAWDLGAEPVYASPFD